MKMLETLLSNFFLSLNLSQLQLASIDLIKLIYISDVEAEVPYDEECRVNILLDLINIKHRNLFFEDNGFNMEDIQFMINDICIN